MAIIQAINVDDVVPPAPSWLKGRASDKWVGLWSLFDRSRINPKVHSDLVALYCQAYSDFLEACDQISQRGLIVKDKNDRVVPNPFVEIRDTAMRQIIDIGKTIGLSPDCSVSWNDYAPTGQEIHDEIPASTGERSDADVADEQR